MSRFIGRKRELAGLQGLLKKGAASLVVIKGRRRIGKSRLAAEFARSFPRSYLLTGTPPEVGVTAEMQRQEFARQMVRLKIPVLTSDDWGNLFTDLAEHCGEGRVLIVLDEISWMGGKDPTFLPKLKNIWDTLMSRNRELILVLTGSNSTWIDENILSATGFLGRISHELHLRELPLPKCALFGDDQVDAYEKFKVLSVTGGVPRYLEEIRPDLSAEQNLQMLCYQSSGILFREFDRIFSDLFARRGPSYKEIVKSLSQGHGTMKELATALGKKKGGDLSRSLDELIQSGFVARDGGWSIGRAVELRQGRYRICDNYVRFYLQHIEPYRDRIETDRMERLPRGWKGIMGLQFENLICNNSRTLFELLGIAPSEVVWSGPYRQAASSRRKGCQIDYLIQTEHRVLYLCEVKFTESPIPAAVGAEMVERAARLEVPRGFSLRNVLIHVCGASEQLEREFAQIIDFGELLAN